MSDQVHELYPGMIYPGHGLPARIEAEASTAPGWSRLAKGAALGQKANLYYNHAVDLFQQTPAQILQLPGELGSDADATQIQLVLAPPLAIPNDDLDGVDIQTMTGEFDNAAMGNFGNYPGTAQPIAWPPLIYIVEWGVGGTKVKAEIDAAMGATVNLTASFVRVYGAIAADDTGTPGTTGVYTLAAFVGPGFPRAGAAQRTIGVGVLAAGATTADTFATPAFAKDVTISAGFTPVGVSSGYVTFFQDPAGAHPVATYFFNGNQPSSFRVPNGGAYFNVTSGLAVSGRFAACFELAI